VDAELLSEEELDVRLRLGDRVARAALDDEGVTAALLTMRAAVQAAAAPAHPRSSRPSLAAALPRYGRRWITALAAATTVAVASLVGVETLTGGGGGGLPLAVSPAAAAVLDSVADAASRQVIPAGRWQYSETRQEQIEPATAAGLTIETVGTDTVQTWVAKDGAMRLRQVRDGVSPLTKRDQAIYLAHERAFWNLHMALREGGGEVTLDGLSSAAEQRRGGVIAQVWNAAPPRDPQTLLTEISRWVKKSFRGGQNAGLSVSVLSRESVFEQLVDILASSTSARLRATAYRALSYLPDTKVLGTRTDQLGRSGVAISASGFPVAKFTLIVSATTGDMLEETATPTKTHLLPEKSPPGLWQMRELVLRRAIVASPTTLPDGGTQPYYHPAHHR